MKAQKYINELKKECEKFKADGGNGALFWAGKIIPYIRYALDSRICDNSYEFYKLAAEEYEHEIQLRIK